MRQSKDRTFREFLSRARAGPFTEDDLTFSNSKVITSLVVPELDGVAIVVKRNKVNRIRLEHFARTRNQRKSISFYSGRICSIHTSCKGNPMA
jgi:hypothetical protein